MKHINKIISFFFAMVLSFSAVADTDPNGKINLILIGPDTVVQQNEEFEVLMMAAANSTPQRYVVADVLIGWNSDKFEFLGVSHTNSHPMVWKEYSGLPYCPPGQVNGCGDFYGVNEVIPPQDGNALYYGYSYLGSVFIIDQIPVQIVKFKFKTKVNFLQEQIEILPFVMGINYPKNTEIFGSYIPGNNVTGTLTNAVITGLGVAGDVDENGLVDAADMTLVLMNWGAVSAKENRCDINQDGIVDSGDLSIILTNWN